MSTLVNPMAPRASNAPMSELTTALVPYQPACFTPNTIKDILITQHTMYIIYLWGFTLHGGGIFNQTLELNQRYAS